MKGDLAIFVEMELLEGRFEQNILLTSCLCYGQLLYIVFCKVCLKSQALKIEK